MKSLVTYEMAETRQISCTFVKHTQQTVWRSDNDITAIGQLTL